MNAHTHRQTQKINLKTFKMKNYLRNRVFAHSYSWHYDYNEEIHIFY